MAPQGLQLSISSFSPNSTRPGGALTVSLNSQAIATWDGMDKGGNVVPNGFYHFVITQTFSDGTQTVMEKSLYVGSRSQTSQVQLTALPNLVHSGDTIHLTGLVEGTLVDGAHTIKIYNISRELVRTLDMAAGQADWDLTDNQGANVASGLYFIVLDVMDPITGSEANKIVKAVVLR
jgi:flagellar hook assembly protein FlgD